MTPDRLSEMHAWIENYRRHNRTYGQCRPAAEAMAAAFPELTIVRGYVLCAPPWGRRAHWWLTLGETGDVFDPTADQFDGLVMLYEPLEPGTETRVGRCMNCGDDIWEVWDGQEESLGRRRDFCSAGCRRSFM